MSTERFRRGFGARLLAVLAGALGTVAPAAAQAVPQPAPAAAAQPMPPIPIDEIRAGMRGHGLSVFTGSSPEPFEVEVLGVLRNAGPDESYIIARLSGRNLEATGIIAGMSGSPVFVDGKVIGALAYAWQFAKEPVAGIAMGLILEPDGSYVVLSDILGSEDALGDMDFKVGGEGGGVGGVRGPPRGVH